VGRCGNGAGDGGGRTLDLVRGTTASHRRVGSANRLTPKRHQSRRKWLPERGSADEAEGAGKTARFESEKGPAFGRAPVQLAGESVHHRSGKTHADHRGKEPAWWNQKNSRVVVRGKKRHRPKSENSQERSSAPGRSGWRGRPGRTIRHGSSRRNPTRRRTPGSDPGAGIRTRQRRTCHLARAWQDAGAWVAEDGSQNGRRTKRVPSRPRAAGRRKSAGLNGNRPKQARPAYTVRRKDRRGEGPAAGWINLRPMAADDDRVRFRTAHHRARPLSPVYRAADRLGGGPGQGAGRTPEADGREGSRVMLHRC